MSVRLRLMNDWVRVRMDPKGEKTVSGTLYKPDDVYETLVRTGQVVDVGPGPLAKKDEDTYLNFHVPTGLEIGDGVVFNDVIATKTKTAMAVRQAVLSDDEALIRPNDVLLIFDYDAPPRFE